MSSKPWERLDTPWYQRWWLNALTLADPKRAHLSWHFGRMERDPEYRDAVHLGMRLRGYESAKQGSNTTGWPGVGLARSADSQALGELHVLRERARVTQRDDPVGSGILQRFASGTVGTGIASKAATGDEAKDEALDAVWAEIKDTIFPAECCGWAGAQLLLARSLFQDGEVWVKRSATPDDEGMFFELVEADRVLTPLDVRARMADPQGQVREGVERDRFGRIRAYWIAKLHPGDIALPGVIMGTPVRVPARTTADFDRVELDDAKHLGLPGRPGQSRAVPMLHAVLQNLRDLDLLVEAAVKRVQIAACLAVFLETAEAITDVFDATAKTYHYQLDQDLVPGMIFTLRPGEKVSTVNPNFPIPDLDTLVKVVARRIGAALGVSWRVVLADLGEANFSAARADRIEAEDSMAFPRHLVVEVLSWIRAEALQDALLRGDETLAAAGVGPEDCVPAQWIPPAKPWLDPKAEAEGAKVAIESGLLSRRDYWASKGKDWRDETRQILAEQLFEQELREELGLAAGPGDGPAEPAAEDEPAEPAADDEPAAEDERGVRKINGWARAHPALARSA